MKQMVLITLVFFFTGSLFVFGQDQSDWTDPKAFAMSEKCTGPVKGPAPEVLPATKDCAACHNVPRIYDELSGSSHEDMGCLECHVPGKAQANKYESGERSFYHLGYYDGHEKWMETSGNDVCLRCHTDRAGENPGKNCWECHMRVDGMDEFVLVKDKKLPPRGDNIKVKKIFPHSSHTFRIHPDAKMEKSE